MAASAAAVALAALEWKRRRLQREAESGESASVLWKQPQPDSRDWLGKFVAAIMCRCASLRHPQYRPTVWASWQLANMLLLVCKCQLMRFLHGRLKVERQMVAPDLYLDWADDKLARSLPPTAPVIAFLHTICGGESPQDEHNLRLATARGFRAVTLIRRGHGGPLTSRASWSLIGDVDDTRAQVAAVVARFPAADFRGMIGLSAGSGLIVSYLGSEGASTPIQAGCSLCPAWDIQGAFEDLATNAPIVHRWIVRWVKQYFVERNASLLHAHSPGGLRRCLMADTLGGLFEASQPFANYSQPEAGMYEVHNPMRHYKGITVPLLIVNSADDIITRIANVREDLVLSTSGAVLLQTKRGGHVAFCEGCVGQGSYLMRVSLDFLEAARSVHLDDCIR